MKIKLIILINLLLLVFTTRAYGEAFRVKAQVQCPMFVIGNQIDKDHKAENRRFRNCQGLVVQAWDADSGPDDYCGSAITDSYGRVNFAANCSDSWGAGRPDVYLKIIAKNSSYGGLKVGVHNWPWYKWVELAGRTLTFGISGLLSGAYDYLTAYKDYQWNSSEKLASNHALLDFGTRVIGANGTSYESKMVSDTYSIAKTSLARIALSGYSPMETRFVVNFPDFLALRPGFPSTIWRTVIAK